MAPMPQLPPLVAPTADLTEDERVRYNRQLNLTGFGIEGQRRLSAARVCVVGAGGLGSPVLLYLAAAGVGTLGIVDDDTVDLANLQRQVLHDTPGLGAPKAGSAAARLAALNPHCRIIEHPERLTAANIADVFGGYDLVIDATDNLPTRYLMADACAALGLPEVWGSVCRTQSQVSLFWSAPPEGFAPVTLRDVFPVEPDGPGCPDNSVLGALCGMTGSLMAAEAIKLITGAGETLLGRLVFLDALSGRTSEVPLRPVGRR